MTDKIKRNIPNIIIVLAIIMCASVILPDLVFHRRYYDVKRGVVVNIMGNSENLLLLKAVEDVTQYEQTFVCDYDKITEVFLMFSEYMGGHPVGLNVVLTDMETGDKLDEWYAETTDLQEYGSLRLVSEDCNETESISGHMCRITVTVTGIRPSDEFGCYARTSNAYEGGSLYVDGEDTGADLMMKIYGHKGIRNLTGVRLWLCTYIILATFLLTTLIRRKRRG